MKFIFKSLDNHMNASVPVSLSPNFFPEFLKILKENSEIMKQITLSLEQEKNRKREFEKGNTQLQNYFYTSFFY